MNARDTFGGGGKPKATRQRRGLSIIEVAMASALLAVAMVPILRSLTKAHMFASEIDRKTYSVILAQNKLDEIKARSIYHYSGSFAQTNLSLGNSYLCNVSDNADLSMRTIIVSVGCDGNGNGILSSDEVEVTLATYIARRW
jgi:Tfp pilus assembly protein PilV